MKIIKKKKNKETEIESRLDIIIERKKSIIYFRSNVNKETNVILFLPRER